MMKFLRDALSDGQTLSPSTKRIVLLMAAIALSLATILLAIAACRGSDVSASLWPVTSALSLIATGSYVGGKAAEGKIVLQKSGGGNVDSAPAE